ncbi:MAG: DUF5398 family protein [Chlamydiia bacterium]|nr:DUF5398 family protein [Chlamydiia bacterium]
MFGLEDSPGGKKKKQEDFIFDLEAEMRDMKNFREMKLELEAKIQKIKTALRSGENKETFDTLGVLLHGYSSLLKVLSRAAKTSK